MKINVLHLRDLLGESYSLGYKGLSFDVIAQQVEKLFETIDKKQEKLEGDFRIWSMEELLLSKERLYFFHASLGPVLICEASNRKVGLFVQSETKSAVYLDDDKDDVFSLPMRQITKIEFDETRNFK